MPTRSPNASDPHQGESSRQDQKETVDPVVGPIVLSSHLAAGSTVPALSEVEFALSLVYNAFSRWIVRGMAAAGEPGMGALEVLVLNAVYHREREKTLSDLCLMLNIEDTHTVTYAIRKLEKRGLVLTGKRAKEKTVAITEAGAQTCKAYAEVREACLARNVSSLNFAAAELSDTAAFLRALSGQYDQASRAATSL